MQVGGGELRTLLYFLRSHSMSCEFGAEPRLQRWARRERDWLGGARDQGALTEQRGFMGGPEGRAPSLCPACMAWSRRGAQVFPPALELGWGPGLGSTRPCPLSGCLAVAGLGPGGGLGQPAFTENSLCAGAVLGKRGCQG